MIQSCRYSAGSSHFSLAIQIPLAATNGHLEERRVICWEWKGNARDEGEAAAQWVSEVVGQPSRVVRFIGEYTTGLKRAVCGSTTHMDFLPHLARILLYIPQPDTLQALALFYMPDCHLAILGC